MSARGVCVKGAGTWGSLRGLSPSVRPIVQDGAPLYHKYGGEAMARAPRLEEQDPADRRGPARLELHLPADLKRRLAVRAAEDGRTIAAVVIEALENYLEKGG